MVMASFAEVLAARKAQLAESALTEDVQVLLGDELVTLRFTELKGMEWAEVTARSAARRDATIDRRYGYNVHGAAALAAPKSGKRVEGDELVPLSEDEWRDLFEVLSGPDFAAIADAMFVLHEQGPAERLESAKKALTVGSKRKRTSPAS
jgi:hypothetical protein